MTTIKLTNIVVDDRLKNRTVHRIGNYINGYTPIEWGCDVCNYVWTTRPESILHQKSGCQRCNNKLRLTNELVDERLREYKIPFERLGDIQNNSKKILWRCQTCKVEWKTAPACILNKQSGCPSCSKKNYSKQSIDWLTNVENQENINIQHALNGGEFLIPDTRYRADGYCKETNTIYEYYGDKFHGNLNIYNAEDNCHPFDPTLTAEDLYQKTVGRERVIKSLGYNIVTMWESDYHG